MAGTIKATLVDIKGNAYEVPPLRVQGPQPLRRNLVISPAGEPLLGSYRLELQAFSSDDRPVSRTAEVLLHRVRIPVAHDEMRPGSYFGVHLGHLAESAANVGSARALGFKWVRDARNFSWDSIAPEEGAGDFEQADQAAEVYAHFRMAVLAVLGPAPRWATKQPENFPLALPLLPQKREDWGHFATTLTERLKGRIHALEPWPEVFSERTLSAIEVGQGSEEDKGEEAKDSSSSRTIEPTFALPEDYVRMQGSAFRAARKANESLSVVMTLNLESERRFAADLITAGAEEFLDVIGFRDFFAQADPTERLVADLEWIAFNLPNTSRIWQTTANAHPPSIFNFYRHTPPLFLETGSMEDAAATVHQYLVAIASGVERIFVTGFALNVFRDLWKAGPRIFNVDGRLNPNATALSNLMWHLEDKEFFRKYNLDSAFDLYTFEGEKCHWR